PRRSGSTSRTSRPAETTGRSPAPTRLRRSPACAASSEIPASRPTARIMRESVSGGWFGMTVTTGGARPRRLRALALVVATALLAAVLPALPGPTPAAHAADAAGWDPGYIISDANFYGGNALDASGVTLFLASK